MGDVPTVFVRWECQYMCGLAITAELRDRVWHDDVKAVAAKLHVLLDAHRKWHDDA